MNILLVDGNEKEASDRYKRLGMETQYEVYEKVLKKNARSDINITTIHPAIHDEYLPAGISLADFKKRYIFYYFLGANFSILAC